MGVVPVRSGIAVGLSVLNRVMDDSLVMCAWR
jgi:hypothetical protein